MTHHEGGDDDGLIAPALLFAVLVFVILGMGLVQVGLSADRHSRAQVAADMAALAAGQEVLDVDGDGVLTPGRGSASTPERSSEQRALSTARRYAVLNLPGLDPRDVTVTLGPDWVRVEVLDREALSSDAPLDSLRRPVNTARATAGLVLLCDPAEPVSASLPQCEASVDLQLVR